MNMHKPDWQERVGYSGIVLFVALSIAGVLIRMANGATPENAAILKIAAFLNVPGAIYVVAQFLLGRLWVSKFGKGEFFNLCLISVLPWMVAAYGIMDWVDQRSMRPYYRPSTPSHGEVGWVCEVCGGDCSPGECRYS